jgi:hypothetical protein
MFEKWKSKLIISAYTPFTLVALNEMADNYYSFLTKNH